MPPKVRQIAMACQAMQEFGIAEGQTKVAVKELLKLYENNWDFIEADNYKVLLDFIVPDNNQPNEERVKSKYKKASYDTTEVIEPPTTRYRTRQRKDQSVANTKYSESSSKRAPPRTMHLKFEEESEDSEDSEPLVRKPRQRHINPQEVPVSGNNTDLVPGDCPELVKCSNLIDEGNFTNFNGCGAGADGTKYLEVELPNENNNPSFPDQSQIEVAPSSVKNALIFSSLQNSGSDLLNAEVPQQKTSYSNSCDRNCGITYVRRRRKDGKDKKKDCVLNQCMHRQVDPSTTRIEPMNAMHCLEQEPVRDSSSSSYMLLAKEVADLRAELEAEKAAREMDRINLEAHCAQFQAVMQQLTTLVPGFQVPQAPLQMQPDQNVNDASHMSLG